MTLPRNRLAKGQNTRIKTGDKKAVVKNEGTFVTLCDKHNVKPLEFRSSKLVDTQGKVTFLQHKEIRANMKASIMVIKYGISDTQKEGIYDLFQLAYDKKVKENQKQADDIKSAVKNFELDKEEPGTQLDGTPVPDPGCARVDPNCERVDPNCARVDPNCERVDPSCARGDPLLETIKRDVQEITDKISPLVTDFIMDSNAKAEITSESETPLELENPLETPNPRPESKLEKKQLETVAKRDKILKNLRAEMEKKANAKQRNKHHRNFISELHDKFGSKMEELSDFKFVEVRKNSSDMVIEHADVYKIDLGSTDTYLLVIGDINMKRDVAKQIDPGFESEKLLDEYDDFLQRIKAKEGTEVTSHDLEDLDESIDVPLLMKSTDQPSPEPTDLEMRERGPEMRETGPEMRETGPEMRERGIPLMEPSSQSEIIPSPDLEVATIDSLEDVDDETDETDESDEE
jgi:NACalpha-BTF3-like transcription factor